MVSFADVRPHSFLLGELERRLEEIYEQPRGRVQARKNFAGPYAFEATITDQSAHNGTILLFHPRLIILVIRSRPRHLDAVLLAEPAKRVVDELSSVVRIDAPHWGSGTCL